jgi:hypothetical protein
MPLLLALGLPLVCACGTDAVTPPSAHDAGANPLEDATAPSSEAGLGANVPLVGAEFGPLIDDMTGQQSKTGGSWYSYSSRTVPNSEPPIPMTDAGSLSPLEGAPFPPDDGAGHVPPFVLDGGSFAARELSGNAIPKWGAGFGMDLVSGLPDGGPVAINACDAGAIFVSSADAGVGIPQPFDASPYTGFAFWGISLGSGDVSLEVHLDDRDTTPWGGTFCDVCRSSGTCSGSAEAGTLDCPCSDNFYEKVVFHSGHWTQYAVRWTDAGFHANNWSHEGPLVFDAAHVYNIHFQDTISATPSTPAFDVAVAYLEWLVN